MKRKTLRKLARAMLTFLMIVVVLLLLLGRFSAKIEPITPAQELPQVDPVPSQSSGAVEAVQENREPKLVYLTLKVLDPPEEEAQVSDILAEPIIEEPEPDLVSIGTYTITAYCPCEICCGWYALNRPLDDNGEPIIYTASGARAEAGTTIGVDPYSIPLGTDVWFEGPDGELNDYTAQDTGSMVIGNHIDLYFDSHEDACDWGLQYREVFKEVPANG